MDAQHIVGLFTEIAAEVRSAIDGLADWGLSGRRAGQYTIDVRADEVVLARLDAAGFGVLSEESGVSSGDRPLLAVVDPIDGSTNAAAGLPWYATSLCALDDEGPLASVVVNQATGDRWHAIRGAGAFRNGEPIHPSGVERLDQALVAVSGLPERHLGWNQFRCFGAAALDLCAVADGTFDAYADLSVDAHGSWDYLGAWLVVREAGGVVVDRHGRELVTRRHEDRRTPLAGATNGVLAQLRAALEE
jgi:fructose-1,6-bisphosphatase/inositol monophosphatase family enzyme